MPAMGRTFTLRRLSDRSRVRAPCSCGRDLGLPSRRTLPCDSRSTRSHTASTSSILCEVHKIPQPSCAARPLIFSRMVCAAEGSSDAVGSSNSSNCGLLSSALASAARVCSPDDKSPHLVLRRCFKSNSLSNASTREPSASMAYKRPKKRRFSLTVRLPGNAAYTAAKLVRDRARARSFAISISPIETRPLVGSSTPKIMLMVVVLPAPFGPRRPTISPRLTVNDTSSSAVTAPYRLRRFTTCRAGGAPGGIAFSKIEFAVNADIV